MGGGGGGGGGDFKSDEPVSVSPAYWMLSMRQSTAGGTSSSRLSHIVYQLDTLLQ